MRLHIFGQLVWFPRVGTQYLCNIIFGEHHDNTLAERRIKSKMPPWWSWQHRQRAATARRSSCLPAGGRRPASKQRLKMEKPAAADHVAQVSAAACVADYWRHRCFRCWWMGGSFWHWIAAYLSALFVKAYHWICCFDSSMSYQETHLSFEHIITRTTSLHP